MSGSAMAGWAVEQYGEVQYDIATVHELLSCQRQLTNEDLVHVFRSADADQVEFLCKI